MLERLLHSDVGAGLEEVEVAPDTLAMLLLLKGTLVTPGSLDRLLVSPQQLLVAIINMLCEVPQLCKHAESLLHGVEGEEALAAVDRRCWKGIMKGKRHGDVPEKWRRHTMGCLDKDRHTQLENAIIHEDEEMALAALESDFGARACRRINHRTGTTALMLAVERRQERVCTAMLSNFGADGCNLHAVDNLGGTALMKTCVNEMDDAALGMLEFGPEACNLGHVGKNGKTALLEACWKRMDSVVVKMLGFGPEECNLGQVDKYGDTSLIIACMKRLEDSALKMLEPGPKACNLGHVDDDGNTALQWACMSRLDGVVVKMLSFGPEACNLGQADNDGMTSLMIACLEGMDGVAVKMLEFGPEACKLGLVTNDGDTALIKACMKKRKDVALKMLEFGPEACKLDQVNNNGDTARDWLVKVPEMQEVLDTVVRMLDTESDVDDV